ncbi:MAG: trimeric intracellular cation channel family protein [Chitinophagaceae bacterium]
MSFNFITVIDILGTFSFVVSGAFAAMEKKLDPLGVLIISFVTAIGGGTIRDMLLGDLPVAWLTNNTSAWVIAISAITAIFFGSTFKKLDKLLFFFDAIGLGLFTMIGIQKGIQHGLSTGICVALGTITACFGGVIRDVLLNKVPLIFQKEIYASACIAGGLLFLLLRKWQVPENLDYIAAILTTFMIRILAVRFNWSLPLFYLRK